ARCATSFCFLRVESRPTMNAAISSGPACSAWFFRGRGMNGTDSGFLGFILSAHRQHSQKRLAPFVFPKMVHLVICDGNSFCGSSGASLEGQTAGTHLLQQGKDIPCLGLISLGLTHQYFEAAIHFAFVCPQIWRPRIPAAAVAGSQILRPALVSRSR